MAIDFGAMAAKAQAVREQVQANQGPGWFSFKDPGGYKFYICPPSEDMNNVPMLGPVGVHYKVGRGEKRQMCLCLGEMNAWIWTEEFQNALAVVNKRREDDGKTEWVVELPTEAFCPVCEELENPESTLHEKDLADMKLQEFYAMSVILISVSDLSHVVRKVVEPAERVIQPWLAKPSIALSGYKGATAIMDLFAGGIDITDPRSATLAMVTRTGREFRDTRYVVMADPVTSREPFVLDKPTKALLKTTAPGQESNLWVFLANLLRSASTIRALLDPPVTSVASNRASGKPPCFGDPQEHDPADPDCFQKCPHFAACGKVVGAQANHSTGASASQVPSKAPATVAKPAAVQPKASPRPAALQPEEPEEELPAPRPAPSAGRAPNPSRPAPRVSGTPVQKAPARVAAPVAEEAKVDAEESAAIDDFDAELDAVMNEQG